ncbi:uncharacterized protein AC631_05211 [Debaryomyces fabryi]|uniref:Uncharacterized protein n=1 Tax=Debaryomyces fabryi TaxID=58627 RepID=A0A0V1PS80_9ASCO|nr:uncharacterized protein AC631_05211 [Debaryomyces fabryi]KRZ99023.1 hypothetical protein AC631_05211 [Debaryomyces fabryi]CUM57049.1 unnamed protein product [Debaryomyces fabryi]
MEEFEGIGSIVDEFQIKGSTLNLFGIKWKTPNSDRELKKFIQIPYGPHNKAFPSLPIITNSNRKLFRYITQDTMMDRSILEYDESKFDSDFELNDSSMNTNLTQFMNDYDINDKEGKNSEYHRPQTSFGNNYHENILSDVILQSTCEEMELVEKNSILSSEFTQLSSNRSENDSSKKPDIFSEKEDVFSLKSEPFADLELGDFVGLQN